MSQDNPIGDKLQQMSERLEIEVTAAVRAVLEKSGYFIPEYMDDILHPIEGWACNLPHEAYDRGYVILPDEQ